MWVCVCAHTQNIMNRRCCILQTISCVHIKSNVKWLLTNLPTISSIEHAFFYCCARFRDRTRCLLNWIRNVHVSLFLSSTLRLWFVLSLSRCFGSLPKVKSMNESIHLSNVVSWVALLSVRESLMWTNRRTKRNVNLFTISRKNTHASTYCVSWTKFHRILHDKRDRMRWLDCLRLKW